MDRNDRSVTAFTMLGHGTFHSYELVIPVFVAIWLDTDAFAVTQTEIGIIVGISYALVGFGAIPSGVLADRFSAHSVILACLLGMGGSFVLIALSPTLGALGVALLLWGCTASLYHPAALALISRGTKNRGTAFAYHGMAGNVGVATGPLLASLLLLGFQWRVVATLLVVPATLAFLIGFRLDFDETAGTAVRDHDRQSNQDEKIVRGDGSPSQTQPEPTADQNEQTQNEYGSQPDSFAAFRVATRQLFSGGFLLVFTIGLVYGVYYRGLFTFLPDVLGNLSLFEAIPRFEQTLEPSQYVYSGLLLVGALGQYAGGKLVDRIAIEYALIGIYSALVCIALVFIPATNANLPVFLAVAGLLGFCTFMVAPVNQEAIAAYSDPGVRGLSFGYTYTAIFGLGAVGATLAGVVLSRYSPAALFALLGGLCGLAVLLGGVLTLHTDSK